MGFTSAVHLMKRPGEAIQSFWSCRTQYETHQKLVLSVVYTGSFMLGRKLFLDGFGLAGHIMSDFVLV